VWQALVGGLAGTELLAMAALTTIIAAWAIVNAIIKRYKEVSHP
jgi:4-hydroxybenzoate polyprenyltransferase